MTEASRHLTSEELQQWQEANSFHESRRQRRSRSVQYSLSLPRVRTPSVERSLREWVTSAPEACMCGSRNVESIACWQFPDD